MKKEKIRKVSICLLTLKFRSLSNTEMCISKLLIRSRCVDVHGSHVDELKDRNLIDSRRQFSFVVAEGRHSNGKIVLVENESADSRRALPYVDGNDSVESLNYSGTFDQ